MRNSNTFKFKTRRNYNMSYNVLSRVVVCMSSHRIVNTIGCNCNSIVYGPWPSPSKPSVALLGTRIALIASY